MNITMELRQLTYFVKVAELRSFSDTAKALFISQSTLSQQVRQLEDELGVPLLIRDSRHVSLSDYGKQFLPCARQILKDAQVSILKIKDVQNLAVGTLNVGVTFTFCPLLKDTVKAYMEQHPGIKLNIFCRSMENLMKMLEHKEIDVALSYRPREKYEKIESHVLFSSSLCAVASRQNVLAGKKSVRLSELERYPLILPAKGLQAREVFDNLLEGQNFRFDIRLEINDIHVILSLVESSDMVTLLSQNTVSNMPGFVTVPIDHPDSEMEGSFHVLKGEYCNKATKEFLRQLIETNSFNLAMETLE